MMCAFVRADCHAIVLCCHARMSGQTEPAGHQRHASEESSPSASNGSAPNHHRNGESKDLGMGAHNCRRFGGPKLKRVEGQGR